MSIATVVTRGYGSFGSIAEVTVRGYLAGAAAAAAAATPTTGGGYPEDGRKEPRHIAKARRAAEKRRLKRLTALDDTVEAVWNKLNPSDQLEVEVVIPDEIKPPDVRVSDLIMRPRIDFERAVAENESYRQAIATLERMLAIYEARLLAEENDIEVLLLAAM